MRRPATPVIPDWTVVTTAAARQTIEGILAAGHYDGRIGELDPDAGRTLARLLRLYACLGRPPTLQDIATDAALSEPSVREHLARLRERDLVLLDPSRERMVGAYPFTDTTTGHSVTFEGSGRTLSTMCAIDALGAGAMCRDNTTIRSACRACCDTIIARTADHGMILRQVAPAGAVVWVGLRQACGCAADTLCTELLFFCSDAHLARWRVDRGDGHRLSPDEAFEVGKALFIDRAIMGRD
jgi:DNA-binding transcriptional ArsR family regulator